MPGRGTRLWAKCEGVLPMNLHFNRNRALAHLRNGVGSPDAQFRTGQLEAVERVVSGAGRLLVVQRTGWGKSFVYFIATKMLRESGMGPALLISPLIALMRNQIAAAERMGVRAATIHSDNQDDWLKIEEGAQRDEVDILLISPERLANERFIHEVLANIADRISVLVVDEAHCISDWGHDFRPHYRLIGRYIKVLPPNLRLLATTATANNRVMADLKVSLGPNLEISRGDLARPSLALQTISMPDQAERLAWLAERLPELPGSGIIYTMTVRDAETVAEWLQSRGIKVESYSSRSGETRAELEQHLLDNRLKALVATTALGMGFDKPDLAFVIHYQAPGSIVAYYQQVGRAGRALDCAYGVLLSGREDVEISNYFIESAFPTRSEVEFVLQALENAPDGLSVRGIEAMTNVSNSRIGKVLQLLSLESPAPVAKLDAKWQLTAAKLGDAFWERVRRLTELRRSEQAQVQEYVQLSSGHMEFLIRALDGDPAGKSPTTAPALPVSTDPKSVRAAVAFLRGSSLDIMPRKQWPPGKTISADHRAEPGKALCAWGDAGWGRLVSRGKYVEQTFSDELVDACATLVRKWRPDPFPEWVTAIPSLRRPDLVPDFARRLAAALELPFRAALTKTEQRPEQKSMANSDKQARNVLGSLDVSSSAILPRPVLLVDDMVDSRWTFTVVAWELRRRGCGEVWPLALAKVGGG